MSRLGRGDLLKRSSELVHEVVSLLKNDLKRISTVYEKDLSRQLFRSVTSIGANMYEADVALSDKELVSKLSIVLKEANETFYRCIGGTKNLCYSLMKVLLMKLLK